MASEEEEDDGGQTLHFTLHLDKALACHVEIAAWNPEKDLLAMVSADHQLTVHRFNWQKLWAISPDKKVTSICWGPDGKALAVGHEDGEICIHDVENGDAVRKICTHSASIQWLYWVEEKLPRSQDSVSHEDRAARFFPHPPKPPAMPGTGSAFEMVGGLAEAQENARENVTSKQFQQHLSILCSTDSDGLVCLNAFGMFAIGELKLQDFCGTMNRQLQAVKVMLSTDLRSMILLCHERKRDKAKSGIVSISVDTGLLSNRCNEIRQVALQASSVEELLIVLQTTLKVMEKHWTDAISALSEKFTGFQELLCKNGRDTTPRDELLSLLACGAVSSPLHQFLAVTLGEGGLKKLAKSIDAAGRELHVLIAEYLQPSAEIIAFRIGELLGLSRWRTQLESVGLDETLVEAVMENAGMLLVQTERFLHIVSETVGQFRQFFLWLSKSLRQFNSEPIPPEQASAINSAAIASFLNTQFEYDPIGPHLSSAGVMPSSAFDKDETMAEEILFLGGFKDVKFLQRTLFQQLDALSVSWREALSKPVAVISPALSFRSESFLCEFFSKTPALSSTYYEMKIRGSSLPQLVDYTCFQMHAEDQSGYIGVVRGFSSHADEDEMDGESEAVEGPEVVMLQLEEHLICVDFSLYKEKQLVLLVSQDASDDCKTQTWIIVFQLDELPFTALSGSSDLLQLCRSKNAMVTVDVKGVKARCIPQLEVIPPLAVSASRGLACIFGAQRRALLYDLEEDEDGKDNEGS